MSYPLHPSIYMPVFKSEEEFEVYHTITLKWFKVTVGDLWLVSQPIGLPRARLFNAPLVQLPRGSVFMVSKCIREGEWVEVLWNSERLYLRAYGFDHSSLSLKQTLLESEP